MEHEIEIAQRNDAFRRTGVGGKTVVTAAVAAMTPDEQMELMRKVKAFDTFAKDNDPHHEHDFGKVEMGGREFYWKIDYYDTNYEMGEEPLSPNCRRVMTVMRTEDY